MSMALSLGQLDSAVVAMWSMPPFFTLQPVLSTRQKQLSLWVQIVLAHLDQHHLNTISVQNTPVNGVDIFQNPAIDRRLSHEGIVAVLEAIVASGYGVWRDTTLRDAVVVSGSQTIADLARLLQVWARDSGHLNEIFTIYELRLGDATLGQTFHGLDAIIILEAARVLEKLGHVSVLESPSTDEVGIKFLNA